MAVECKLLAGGVHYDSGGDLSCIRDLRYAMASIEWGLLLHPLVWVGIAYCAMPFIVVASVVIGRK